MSTARLPVATETGSGIVERATQAEVNAGTDDTRYITPAKLKAAIGSGTVPPASETSPGVIELATQAEVNAGSDSTRAVTPATLRSSLNLPWAMAAGSFIHSPNIVANAFVDLTITFPAGKFSVPPIVIVNNSSVRVTTGAQSGVTTTGCTIRLFNGTTGTAVGGHIVRWQAIQMTQGSESG